MFPAAADSAETLSRPSLSPPSLPPRAMQPPAGDGPTEFDIRLPLLLHRRCCDRRIFPFSNISNLFDEMTKPIYRHRTAAGTVDTHTHTHRQINLNIDCIRTLHVRWWHGFSPRRIQFRLRTVGRCACFVAPGEE